MPHQRLRTTEPRTLRRWACALGTALVLTAGLAGLPATAHASDGPTAEMVNRLEQSNWLASFQVPGVAVVQIRDGGVTWSKGYGTTNTSNGVPVTANTIFRVGSITKSVTAWGVMRLVEQGRMDLDTPVESYLTRWHLPPSPFDPDGVTIGRLLNHTAGLNMQDYSPVTTRPLPSLEQSLSGGSGKPGDRNSDNVRITTEPGTQMEYSNGGYTMLQLAIEEVTGEAFASYMQREVLDPLGMTRSSFVERPELAAETATGYTNGGRPVPPTLLTEQAAGGLYTSANDVARFAVAAMTGPSGERPGRGVLTPAGVATLLSPITVAHGMTTSFGYEVETLSDGTKAAGHGGKNTGWLSQFTTLPDRAEGLVVLTNSDNDGLIGFTTQAWADSLGVGHPRTTQRLMDELSFQYTLMLSIGAVLGTVALGGGFFLIRGQRSGHRTWAWRGVNRLQPLRASVRIVAPLAVFVGAAAWWLYPVRITLASISPVRTSLATAALLTLCLTAAAAALTRTRRVPAAAPAEQVHALAPPGTESHRLRLKV
ncbi:serine hydrolase domain-containing protein [Knoellia sp. S7-12]|uniref:serine hydrolase domain-containing protein n=1 Tax=Knoellia sp. S7-12 TaxID=3126698 RepID=UPI0033664AB9